VASGLGTLVAGCVSGGDSRLGIVVKSLVGPLCRAGSTDPLHGCSGASFVKSGRGIRPLGSNQGEAKILPAGRPGSLAKGSLRSVLGYPLARFFLGSPPVRPGVPPFPPSQCDQLPPRKRRVVVVCGGGGGWYRIGSMNSSSTAFRPRFGATPKSAISISVMVGCRWACRR
jgi:hypothetical protein